MSRAKPHRAPLGDAPDAVRSSAQTSPSPDLIESWLGDSMQDAELHLGKDVATDADDAEARAAARRFRDVLGRFASGVTVVTAMSGAAPVGLTCQSFCSASLNPPLVVFIPAKTSRAWPAIQRAGRFCVNFLTADQAELSNKMADTTADKFAGVAWSPSPVTGSPVVHDTLAYVDCAIQGVHEAGDHDIVIGRVLDLGVAGEETGEDRPLLFFRGAYTTTPDQNA